MTKSERKVGIDLTQVSRRTVAAGTARYVLEQAQALFRLSLPWRWVAVFDEQTAGEIETGDGIERVVIKARRTMLHCTMDVGRIWMDHGCILGFATAYLIPWQSLPVAANFFDANLWEPVDAWQRRQNLPKYWLFKYQLIRTLRRARKIFILSEYGVKRLAQIYPRFADKFVMTPGGVNPPRPCPPRRPTWAQGLDFPFFLYVGAFSDNKNQRRLIEAWNDLQKQYPDFPGLVMIGPCRADYRREALSPLLARLSKPGKIILPGFVDEDSLAWAYHHAVAYLQPSIAEGFGLPVIEAMSYGLSVACSNTTSLPATAGDAAIYFNPFDIRNISAAIHRLWNDDALRHRLAELGKARASRFTWEANARIVGGVIEDLVARSLA